MNKLTIKNIHKACRACLHILENGESLETFPHLKNFCEFLIDQIAMPKIANSIILCSFCFQMLQNLEADYKKFQNMVLNSSKRMQAILQEGNQNADSIVNKPTGQWNDEDDDDDNKLLLPELAAWNNLPSVEEISQAQAKEEIKAEIVSDIDGEDNYDSFDSTCDGDGDDDEPFVANETYEASTTSSMAMGMGTVEGQQQQPLNSTEASGFDDFGSRKRDRRKKSYKCPTCNKHAYKKVYLDAHIRKIHQGLDKPFLCSVTECQKAFTRYNQLHVHIQTNHSIDAIKFTCDIEGCNASFRLGQTLESHRRIVHKFQKNLVASLEAAAAAAAVAEKNNQQHMQSELLSLDNCCEECGKNFHSKKSLTEHLRRHANDKRFVCDICHVSKVTKTELRTHKRVHDRNLEKFKCTLCPQEFNHKNAISRHIRVVHEGERRFSCRFCPRRFGTKNSQVCHERLHTGEKPYQCEVCQKGFTQVEGLKSHMKNHDKNLRKHVCKFCSQRFITKKNLVDHESRHLGSKPHICKFCSRGFTRAEDLTVHLKNQHDNGTCSNDLYLSGGGSNDLADANSSNSSSNNNSNEVQSEQNHSAGIQRSFFKKEETDDDDSDYNFD